MKMKTAHELRELVSTAIDDLNSRAITIQKAQTIANLVGKYLHSIRLQLEYVRLKMTAENLRIPALEATENVEGPPPFTKRK